MRSVGRFKNKNDNHMTSLSRIEALQIQEEIFPVTLENHDFSSILSLFSPLHSGKLNWRLLEAELKQSACSSNNVW